MEKYIFKNNNYERIKEELNTNGYIILRNILNDDEIQEYKNEFFNWYNNVTDLKKLHNIIEYNGIFKFHEVGNQRFAWLVRTNEKIINVFKDLWQTDELVTSFDGACYYPTDYICSERYWTHTDQSSRKKGIHCYQSFISLTNNEERTLQLYKGSNLLHEDYFIKMNIDSPSDWNIIDPSYINNIINTQVNLKVNAGDLVIWDSRTFHQNLCGNQDCMEERLVQYLCYLPKNGSGNTIDEENYRKQCFKNKRTTSHWPYPIYPVNRQPELYNSYSKDKIYIDYKSLDPPKLDDLKEQIDKLL